MSPSTRALLAAAREGLGPDPAAAARVRARLDAVLAGTATAAAPAAATGGVALKLAAIVVAAAGAIAVVAIPQRAAAPTPAPALSLDEAAYVDVPAPTVHAASREPAAPPPTKPVAVHIATPAETPPPQQPAAEVSLAREVQLIDDAMASLRAGDPTAALAAMAAFHRETGDRGQLLQEATAIDIEASCRLHLDVTSKLAAFDRTWPSSPQRARLTAACP